MEEVAEEVSAAAAAESLGVMTELAKRDARITQLGSRIEDLQVTGTMSERSGDPFLLWLWWLHVLVHYTIEECGCT